MNPLECVRRLDLMEKPAKEVSLKTLDDYLVDSYGTHTSARIAP